MIAIRVSELDDLRRGAGFIINFATEASVDRARQRAETILKLIDAYEENRETIAQLTEMLEKLGHTVAA